MPLEVSMPWQEKASSGNVQQLKQALVAQIHPNYCYGKTPMVWGSHILGSPNAGLAQHGGYYGIL